jgi:hypothetical protein
MSTVISSELVHTATQLGIDVSVAGTFLHFKPIPTSQSACDGELCSSSRDTNYDSADDEQRSHSSVRMVSCDGSPENDTGSLLPDYTSMTTVMVRNVPNSYTQDELMRALRRLGYSFNIFYCPIDHINEGNLGYFFVNLLTPPMAANLVTQFHGTLWPDSASLKACVATWARIQGYESNVEFYRASPMMRMGSIHRPRVFTEDGSRIREFHVETFQLKSPITRLPSTRKVFVGGLSPFVSIRTVKNHLKRYGDIEHVSFVYDPVTQHSRGFCFVTFVDADSAQKCTEANKVHTIHGKRISVRPYSIGAPEQMIHEHGCGTGSHPVENTTLDDIVLDCNYWDLRTCVSTVDMYAHERTSIRSVDMAARH